MRDKFPERKLGQSIFLDRYIKAAKFPRALCMFKKMKLWLVRRTHFHFRSQETVNGEMFEKDQPTIFVRSGFCGQKTFKLPKNWKLSPETECSGSVIYVKQGAHHSIAYANVVIELCWLQRNSKMNNKIRYIYLRLLVVVLKLTL